MHIKKAVPVLAGATAVGGAVFWAVRFSRAAVEKPDHSCLRKEGRFEVREYPALTVATTEMREGRRDSAFLRLFNFLDRANDRGRKIAMTAPVFIDRAGGQSEMSFVMPAQARQEGVPAPTDVDVKVHVRPPRRVAVYRYSGGGSAENELRALAALRAWMAKEGLTPTGEPAVAYYDAPYIPPFLRRNEVMLGVSEA
jgi:hypothetical protein